MIRSSAIPSAKYSWSPVGLMSANGSTAIDGTFAVAGGATVDQLAASIAATLNGVEGVDGDVDPPYAAVMQRVGELGQLTAVGRQRQFVQRSGVKVTRQASDDSFRLG